MVPVESLMRRKLFLNLSQDFSFNLFYQYFFPSDQSKQFVWQTLIAKRKIKY